MCHILLLMPLLGLPVFWLMPLGQALPVYTIIVLISGLLYWLIWRSTKISAELGPESVIGTEAEVVSILSPRHPAQYLVRAKGELWSARCTDTLQPGEKVNVADLSGINLIVKPESKAISNSKIWAAEERNNCSRINKWHCR